MSRSRRCGSQFGVVPQEPFLFAGTVRDNIAFARPDATDAEVQGGVSNAVGIDDLVGVASGRDRHARARARRLALFGRASTPRAGSRASVARPRVLVLDEATSSLDLASEAHIERALDAILQGRTAIVIAHRLATAMRADRIAVVEGGRIVELGTHAELLALGGHYEAMHASWARHTASPSGPPSSKNDQP